MWLSHSVLLHFFQKAVQIVKLTTGSSDSQWIQCSVVSRLKPSAKPDPSSVRACLLRPGGLHFNFVKIPFVCNYLSTFIYPGPLRLKQQVSKELKIMYLLSCILPTFLGSTACSYMHWRAMALTSPQDQGQSEEMLPESPFLPAAYLHHSLQSWHKTGTLSSHLCHNTTLE